MKHSGASSRTYFIMALAFASSLGACTNENRMVTVECGAPPGANLAASFQESFAGPPTWGLITANPLPPGSLLELSPLTNEQRSGHLISTYLMKVSEGDFLPPRQDSTFWALVDAEFKLKFFPTFIQGEALNNTALVDRIVINTTAVVSGSKRVMLRDPLAVLNSDQHAREFTLNAEAQSRFVMVTGLLYGDRIDLIGLNYSEHPEIAVNTLELRNAYLHYMFSCSSVDAVNSRAQLAGKSIPVAFIYRPVRYSETGNFVWNDATFPKLARYDNLD